MRTTPRYPQSPRQSVIVARWPRATPLWTVLLLSSAAGLILLTRWQQAPLADSIRGAIPKPASGADRSACQGTAGPIKALPWPATAMTESPECRRDQAAALWRQGRAAEALALQRGLVEGSPGRQEDQERLKAWQAELRRTALQRFRAGDLRHALATLKADRDGAAMALSDQLLVSWDRNRLAFERASSLARQSRWWEALDSLDSLDHPWWTRHAAPLRRQIAQGLSQLKAADREHDGHGAIPHTVPAAELDAEVRRRIASGANEWAAFEGGCAALGGKVVEAGPESACQR